MRRIAIVLLWLFTFQYVFAYVEYPPFERTRFATEYGMFRWYRGCWFRVLNAYVYIICDPSGQVIERLPIETVPALVASGVLPADSRTGRIVARLLGGATGSSATQNPRTRSSASRLTAASGDGIGLSNYYGGTFTRFDGFDRGDSGVFRFDGNGRPIANGSSAGGFSFSGGDSSGSDSGGGFTFGSGGNGSSGNFGDNGSSSGGGDSGAFSGGDGFFSTGGGTRMNDVFYQPLGLFGCDDIHDSIDGGLFGPIPCTSYPGVFGPKVEYGRSN